MHSRPVAAVLVLASIAAISALASAAPSLDIRKPPVQPDSSWTGPSSDPQATRGQWFTGVGPWRTHEFYDNMPGSGGSIMGSDAIKGITSSVVYRYPGGPILAFDICVWITNDLPGEGQWEAGGNSHGEGLSATTYYADTMYGVELTGSFAIDPSMPPPWPPPGPPYIDRLPYIGSTNHDRDAWYCWTPGNPVELEPWGEFYVPTWDFGNIAPGATVMRKLSFVIYDRGPLGTLFRSELPPSDPRWGVIDSSWRYDLDVLLNRTTSLKVSDWIDELALDPRTPYPTPPGTSSDCSVFHIAPRDWGDAPDPTYPTLDANNGPNHMILDGFCLGTAIDTEGDGQPTEDADGDDLNPTTLDDEDGVTWLTPLIPGQPAQVQVQLAAPTGVSGYLDAWIDFNGDGDWTDFGEQIAASALLSVGTNAIGFNVPAEAAPTVTFSRFRLSSAGGLQPTGAAADGEVEDHKATIQSGLGALLFEENIEIPDHFWYPTSDQYNEMLSLTISAGQFESVRWDTVTLQATGSGQDAAEVAQVDVWIDANSNGEVDPDDTRIGTGQYGDDDDALTIDIGTLPGESFNVIVAADTSLDVLVSYTMIGLLPTDFTYQFLTTDATGAGQTSGQPATILGLPIVSALKVGAPQPITIGEAKRLPANSTVFLEGKVVTADFLSSTSFFYIQEEDRSAGIRVRSGSSSGPLTPGERVSVLGWTRTTYPPELALTPRRMFFSPGDPVEPLVILNKSIGGAAHGLQSGISGAADLNNIGLLVTTSGEITERDATSPPAWFKIDDGSDVNVKCLVPSGVSIDPSWTYVVVTGISSCEKPDNDLLRLIRIRSADDITVRLPAQ